MYIHIHTHVYSRDSIFRRMKFLGIVATINGKKIGCKCVTFDSHRRRLPRPSLAKISYVRKIYRYTSSDILLSLLPSIEISGRAGVQQRRPFSLSNALRHRLPAPLLFPKSYYAASRWRVSTNPFMRFLLISGTGTVLPFAFLDPRLSIASISNQPPSLVSAHQPLSIISPLEENKLETRSSRLL